MRFKNLVINLFHSFLSDKTFDCPWLSHSVLSALVEINQRCTSRISLWHPFKPFDTFCYCEYQSVQIRLFLSCKTVCNFRYKYRAVQTLLFSDYEIKCPCLESLTVMFYISKECKKDFTNMALVTSDRTVFFNKEAD